MKLKPCALPNDWLNATTAKITNINIVTAASTNNYW